MLGDYSWMQSAKDVFVTVPCEAGTRGKDVIVSMTPATISLSITVSVLDSEHARVRARVSMRIVACANENGSVCRAYQFLSFACTCRAIPFSRASPWPSKSSLTTGSSAFSCPS